MKLEAEYGIVPKYRQTSVLSLKLLRLFIPAKLFESRKLITEYGPFFSIGINFAISFGWRMRDKHDL